MIDITNEYGYLIHLVRCALLGESPQEKPRTLSFERVYKIALSHEIANIAFYSVERLLSKPEPSLYTEWELSRDLAVTRDINQSFARDEITAELDRHGIRFLEVQGTVIKPLYPSPEYRTMSDIDFIIDQKNLDTAQSILMRLGYTCKKQEDFEVDGFRPPNIAVEVHSEYFTSDTEYHGIMRPPFDTVEKNGEYDINELYIYNMLHISKHYFVKGCGIRRVIDAYYLNRNYGALLNREYVASVFDKAEVTEFVKDFSSLAEYWFGDGEYDERFDDMSEYIFGSSLHGTKQNVVNNRLRKRYSSDDPLAKPKYFLSRVFTGDKVMLKRYPILKKQRFLYPFCWMHRLFLALFSSGAKGILDEAKDVINADMNQKQ